VAQCRAGPISWRDPYGIQIEGVLWGDNLAPFIDLKLFGYSVGVTDVNKTANDYLISGTIWHIGLTMCAACEKLPTTIDKSRKMLSGVTPEYFGNTDNRKGDYQPTEDELKCCLFNQERPKSREFYEKISVLRKTKE
jgi:hypothetical protein